MLSSQKSSKLSFLQIHINLILMVPCIVDYSVEIPTRCSFVIEFIIPKFFKAQPVSSGSPLVIRSSKPVFAASGLYAHMATSCCQG